MVPFGYTKKKGNSSLPIQGLGDFLNAKKRMTLCIKIVILSLILMSFKDKGGWEKVSHQNKGFEVCDYFH